MNPDNKQQPDQTPQSQPGQSFSPQNPVPGPSPATPASFSEGAAQTSYMQTSHNNDPPSNQTKKIIIAIGVLLGIFVLLVIIVLITSGGSKQQQPPNQQAVEVENLVKEPSAVELQTLTNSVSDDISNMSTDSDFPADTFSDDNLSL